MKLIPIYSKNLYNPAVRMLDDFMSSYFDEDIKEDCKLMNLDVVEKEKEFEVFADLPGVLKNNITITHQSNQLKIASMTEKREDNESGKILRKERFGGCYQRTLKLPEVCDVENIKANLENGVLHLIIPKKGEQLAKSIAID